MRTSTIPVPCPQIWEKYIVPCQNNTMTSIVPVPCPDLGKAHCTTPHPYEGQYHSSTVPIDLEKTMITVQSTAQPMTSFRTTTLSTAMTGRMTTIQVKPVYVHPETSCKALLEHCMHVHQPTVQVCKPGESLALRKVKYPLNGRTSVNRLPLTKQDILSQYIPVALKV